MLMNVNVRSRDLNVREASKKEDVTVPDSIWFVIIWYLWHYFVYINVNISIYIYYKHKTLIIYLYTNIKR